VVDNQTRGDRPVRLLVGDAMSRCDPRSLEFDPSVPMSVQVAVPEPTPIVCLGYATHYSFVWCSVWGSHGEMVPRNP
jgi:hypothetical protein